MGRCIQPSGKEDIFTKVKEKIRYKKFAVKIQNGKILLYYGCSKPHLLKDY